VSVDAAQLAPPWHVARGSSPSRTSAQTPSAFPVAEARQASHTPPQRESQHTPSTQNPEVQSADAQQVSASPRSRPNAYTLPREASPPASFHGAPTRIAPPRKATRPSPSA
jgi:hypothetical protein